MGIDPAGHTANTVQTATLNIAGCGHFVSQCSKLIPVIIPAYRKPHQLDRCLLCLLGQTMPVSVIIEDNNEHNRGYTKAINDGLRKVDAGYAIVLNQDAYLEADAVWQMVQFMEAHPRCAIGGVKQLRDEDHDFIWHGGGVDVLPAGQHYQGRVSNGDCNRSMQVGWVNGACQIVRMAALSDIGLMDEKMVLCGSDADWCVSAKLAGWECWYIAEAVCRHEVGVSESQSPEVAQIIAKDMAYFTRKLVGLIPSLASISE